MIARTRFSVLRLALIGSLTLTLTSACGDIFELIDTPEHPDTPASSHPASPQAASDDVRQISPSDGAIVSDQKTVSGVFEVQFSSASSGDRVLKFPVSAQDLPADFEPEDLQLERYDEGSDKWIPEGVLSGWDPASKTAAFEVKNPLTDNFSTQLLKLYKYRMRVYIFYDSVSVKKEDSNFRITYYPISYGYTASVKKDADWAGSGLNDEPAIPNYIEDLDKALNEAYQGLLGIKDQSGNALFKKLKTPIEVEVLDTGTDLGNSNLGGTAKISATKIKNWPEMRQTAAHELTHVFQGQYYSASGLFTARPNTWFIEATAQYFADLALGLDDVQRAELYGDGLRYIERYLSVPVTATDSSSYYALGHFFSWATIQAGQSLIPETLRRSLVRDSRALDARLKSTSAFDGLGDAVNQYGQFIMTHPEYDAGFATGVKNAMRAYSRQFIDEKSTNFTKADLYMRFKRDLFPLASNYLSFLATELDGDNLLVLAPVQENDGLQSLIHTNPGKTAADYQAKTAVNSGDSLYEKQSVTVPHFGKGQPQKALEIWINNPSLSSTEQGDFEIYALRPPQVLEVLDGSVRWDQTAIADLPTDKIKGYAVYIGKTLLKKEIPFKVGASEQILKHKDIQKQSDVRVTLTDTFDHEWPLADTQSISILIKDIALNNGGVSRPDLPNIVSPDIGPGRANEINFNTEVSGTTNQNIKWQLAGMGTGGGGSLVKATPILDQDMSIVGTVVQTGQHVRVLFNPDQQAFSFCWLVGTSAADPSVRYLLLLEVWHFPPAPVSSD